MALHSVFFSILAHSASKTSPTHLKRQRLSELKSIKQEPNMDLYAVLRLKKRENCTTDKNNKAKSHSLILSLQNNFTPSSHLITPLQCIVLWFIRSQRSHPFAFSVIRCLNNKIEYSIDIVYYRMPQSLTGFILTIPRSAPALFFKCIILLIRSS